MVPLVSLQLPGAPIAPRVARHALGGFDWQLGTAHDDVVLLVSELVTNAVRHAEVDAGRPVLLTVWADEEEVRVEVHDEGQGPGPQPRTPEPGVAGGWGLRLVADLADRWGVEREAGTTVWFTLSRR